MNMIKLADKQIGQRSCQQWSMGFQVVSAEKFAELADCVDLVQMIWMYLALALPTLYYYK